MKEDEMGRVCGTQEGLVQKPEGRRLLGRPKTQTGG